ncbi:tRNA lysidine(34) synthetase TilS [Paenibacillus shirakamiensis]|nr:tRNA lysidine(34) synthetase TilS [Paenibacillus shirakamiensis]
MNFINLLNTTREVGRASQLWSRGDCIVVAVSGGPDSIALLHVLHALSQEAEGSFQLICAHINHGFRGKESREEADFVRQIASDLQIPFELGEPDVTSYMIEAGLGLQVAAREKRYEFLHDVASKYQANSIALAHHADDQAETVMFRILRGTSPTGMAGMKLKRKQKKVELIRPFLRIYKTDLLEVCRNSGLDYRIDSSNLSNKYARNAVRLDVLPFLGQYNAQLVQSLNRLAEVAGEEDDYMQHEVQVVYDRIVGQHGAGIVFSVKDYTGLHVALQRRLIKLILNYLPQGKEDMEYTTIERIREQVVQDRSTTWTVDIGGGLRCIREYDTIYVLPDYMGLVKQEYTYQLEEIPARYPIPGTRSQLSVTASASGVLPDLDVWNWRSNDKAVFDADELVYPLIVRSRLPGDVMKVMGLNGSKKVKDIFIDQKIPPSLRTKIPMVTDGAGRILWLPGVRRSALAVVSETTTSMVFMELESDRLSP